MVCFAGVGRGPLLITELSAPSIQPELSNLKMTSEQETEDQSNVGGDGRQGGGNREEARKPSKLLQDCNQVDSVTVLDLEAKCEMPLAPSEQDSQDHGIPSLAHQASVKRKDIEELEVTVCGEKRMRKEAETDGGIHGEASSEPRETTNDGFLKGLLEALEPPDSPIWFPSIFLEEGMKAEIAESWQQPHVFRDKPSDGQTVSEQGSAADNMQLVPYDSVCQSSSGSLAQDTMSGVKPSPSPTSRQKCGVQRPQKEIHGSPDKSRQGQLVAATSSNRPAHDKQQQLLNGLTIATGLVMKSRVMSPQHQSQQLMIIPEENACAINPARDEVLHALTTYRTYFHQFELEGLVHKIKGISGEAGNPSAEPQASKLGRADIRAYRKVKEEGKDVNGKMIIGEVPGVQVGDTFKFRHEMAVVGLHHLPNCGIAYVPNDVATCVVVSANGSYVDNADTGERVVYTGHGGRSSRAVGAAVIENQKWEKGNKAMWTNFERKVVVRLVRGHLNLKKSKTVIGYTYDGLYRIVNREYVPGKTSLFVYKFTLERVENQPPIPPCMEGCTEHPWNRCSSSALQIYTPSEESKENILAIDYPRKASLSCLD